MSRAMQAKLLRVLEEREVRPVGGTSAAQGRRARRSPRRTAISPRWSAPARFREDLYYRLAAITVRVPSLRERPEDIPVIARAILARDPPTQRHAARRPRRSPR